MSDTDLNSSHLFIALMLLEPFLEPQMLYELGFSYLSISIFTYYSLRLLSYCTCNHIFFFLKWLNHGCEGPNGNAFLFDRECSRC